MKPGLFERLKAALQGHLFYSYTTVFRVCDGIHAFTSQLPASSLASAVQAIAAKWPDHTIRSICQPSVGVELVVAYPCRLARWVFTYRKMRRIEDEAVKAVLGIQTRKSVLREIQRGRAVLEPAVAAVAVPDFSPPDHLAEAPEGRRNPVTMDEHGPEAGSTPAVRQEAKALGAGSSYRHGGYVFKSTSSSAALEKEDAQ